jgi:hypothetical protein
VAGEAHILSILVRNTFHTSSTAERNVYLQHQRRGKPAFVVPLAWWG